MLLRSGIVFLMCAKILHLTNAEDYCLTYDDDDLPLPTYETVTVRYCHRKTQKCCGTECCDDHDNTWNFFWGILILCGVGMIIGICAALKYCRTHFGSTNAPDNMYSVRMSANQVEPRRDLPGLEINTTLLANRHEDAEQGSKNHPITPPPAYNVAILAPSAPALLPENRIPSYEDVTAGKRT